jgi:hypothetical protein
MTLQAAYAFLAQFFAPASVATATLIRRVDSSAKARFCERVTERVVRFDWQTEQAFSLVLNEQPMAPAKASNSG